jgi:hypothetical protein
MHFLARFSTDTPRIFVHSHLENDRYKLHSPLYFISQSFTQNSKFDHVWPALATSLYKPAAVLAELPTSLSPHPPPSPLHLGLPALNCQTTRSRAPTSFCRRRYLGLDADLSLDALRRRRSVSSRTTMTGYSARKCQAKAPQLLSDISSYTTPQVTSASLNTVSAPSRSHCRRYRYPSHRISPSYCESSLLRRYR